MLISVLIVTGSVATIGSLQYQASRRKTKLVEALSSPSEYPQKTRFSLYNQII